MYRNRKVVVVMPAYNAERTLLRTYEEVMAQGVVDRVVIVNTWHHVEEQAKYLDLLKRAVRPGGQVIHIDYHARELPVGPPVGMKIPREEVVRQMEAAGFRLAAEHSFLPYQYFLVFEVR